VICEITDPPTRNRGPLGRILTVLGESLTPSLAVEMAIASHDLPHEWPEAVLASAADRCQVQAADTAGRVDLRDCRWSPSTARTARDFDDAVYCEPPPARATA
jgi:ribonuclease R